VSLKRVYTHDAINTVHRKSPSKS